MPYIFNKMIVVTEKELVPEFYTLSNLKASIQRSKNSPYGINRVQRGGNGNLLLIELESLPGHIQEAMSSRRYGNYQTLLSNLKSKNK